MANRESAIKRAARAERIVRSLRELYSDAHCALRHRNAFELLVATILSAQSTDETVNKVTPNLFKAHPSARDLAAASVGDIEAIIRPTGFFRQKAKNIVAAAGKIMADFGGEVPADMESLLTLPGVARKTANVVLGTWFGRNDGVVVDTHVGRIAERLKLTWTSRDSKDAQRIESDLMQVIPRDDWTYWSHALIWHGRAVCTARKPACDECGLAVDCPSAGRVGSSVKGGRPARRPAVR